jgi:hypothetical protein
MAEPNIEDIQGQVKAAQESAMAIAQQFQPPPVPQIPLPQAPVSMGGVSITMGKVSLLATALSLMMLGALTFVGGFLFGIWFAGPTPAYTAYNFPTVPQMVVAPTQPQTVQQAPVQGQPVAQTVRSGADAIGFGQIASSQARNITQSTITGVTVPGVPSFLTPLVTSTQYAIGQQLGYKAQQQVGQTMSQPAAPVAQQPQAQPQMQMQPQPQQQPQYQPQPTAQPQMQAPAQPQGMPLPQAPAPVPGAKAGQDEFTIQVGVFATSENAQSLVDQLKGMNHPSLIVEGKSQEGTPLYYVQSGMYKDYTTATQAASQFASQNMPGALIVKVSQSQKGAS